VAKPTVNVVIPMSSYDMPFQPKAWAIGLKETVPDSAYTTRIGSDKTFVTPKPGCIRWEGDYVGKGAYSDVYALGQCAFMWVLNRSGATLEQFSFVSKPANLTGNLVVSGTVSTITGTLSGGGTFTADELTHTLLCISDDAGGSHADPEGDWCYVVENTTTVLYCQPDFLAAPAVGDTFDIWYPHNLEDSADGDEATICQGVVMSPDGIADNYWGWVGVYGLMGVALVGAVTAGDAVVAAAASVGASGSDPVDLMVGYAPHTYQAAHTHALININTLYPTFNAAS